ncbi:unnamed protein product [Parnassius mnemosyne]|uniref:Integrase catalytic domain-containing protein n=1 Tax=Parnassius mnemosyne TaxID=213953 RepID=A0AAV1LI24_9NEOP
MTEKGAGKDRRLMQIKLLEAKRQLYFSQINKTFQLSSKTDEKSRHNFLSQARAVDQLRKEFVTMVDDINLLNLEVDPDYSINYQPLSAFDDLYYFIKDILNSMERPNPQSQAVTHAINQEHTIKIPRIELPIFDGELQNFPYFYETFKRVIHENKTLTDSERIHYLMSHLSEKAKHICAGIIPAADNYVIIWQTLQDKYKDTRALATTYLNQLFALKNINGPSAINLENLVDKYAATIAALKQLNIDNLSDFIFVYMGLKLVDSDTAKCFETTVRSQTDMPKYDDFVKFLREQVKILYRTSTSSQTRGSSMAPHPNSGSRPSSSRALTVPPRVLVSTQQTQGRTRPCKLCNNTAHTHLYACKPFANLSAADKFKFVKDNRYCVNCLSNQHTSFYCNSNTSCRKCNARHHTLLHFGNEPFAAQSCTATVAVNEEHDTSEILSSLELEEESSSDQVRDGYLVGEGNPEVSYCSLSSTKCDSSSTTQVLATAKVYATGRDGRDVIVRCLLDPGSQKHYITTKCCSKLQLKVESNSPVTVKGIGGSSQIVKGAANISFRSRFNNTKFNIQALVLNRITSNIPTCNIDTRFLENLRSIPMADDGWGMPGEIDLLIGVSLFAEMLRPGKIIGEPGSPDALETVLGYIVLGDAPAVIQAQAPAVVAFHAISTSEVETLVRKMWELDEIDPKHIFSADDKICEENYSKTVTRATSGRYEVALPFKFSPDLLGNSLKVAGRRFLHLERRFTAQPALREAYDSVIKDYIYQGYLSPIDTADKDPLHFYMPHHAVLREDKLSTRIRPVLDASAKSSSGFSLNDLLYAGPKLQRDLFTILMNMRLLPVAITADVRQMYLRIGVRKQDRRFQRILYRFSRNDNLGGGSDIQIPIKSLEFNRVAFGLKCSPFLALRTVSQLVQDEGHRFPIGKEVVQRDLYMDDIASSLMNSDRAISAFQELIGLFKAGGFDLVKWSSNSTSVLEYIPEDYRLSQNVEFHKDDTLKILGLYWRPHDDEFAFKVISDDRPCTKRNILSSVARLFDVLGLVAPVILYAKLLIKELWIAKIDWDADPPERITRLWNEFRRELPLLAQMKFPRHLRVVHGCSVTILGFADASEKAYGAAVYIRVDVKQIQTTVILSCAKSKVAPLKVVSLARLELCAALLLSKLIKKVFEIYSSRYPIDSVLAFSDSTVVLNWIHSSPHRWHTFVANRVSKIQDNLPSDHFYHIKGNENPCDCLSRGLTPTQLMNHPLWLQGPPWAHLQKTEWPIKTFVPKESSDAPELKSISLVIIKPIEEPFLYKLARNYSSWQRFLNVASYIYKFIRKLPLGPIVESDLEFTELEIMKVIQSIHFSDDLQRLEKGGCRSPSIKKLNPFLKDGVLRVGGRLANSEESFDFKHPILLPCKDHVVDLLIRSYHCKYLHTGPGLLSSVLRVKYWILSARRAIRAIISKCNVCFRSKPQPGFPMMADLPEPRVRAVVKAFVHTGCDYAGPVLVTPYRGKGIKSRKAYICLFTCLTTRAVHIELASDLSTACFLAAMKRFLARRGSVQCFYTDNGTNFIGARSYLRDLYAFLKNEYKPVWEKQLAESRIQWKLIPPNAPHFGGCWESNIKCIKTHLYRVIGQQILTFEELQTVLSQIESILNSRPLTVLSSDPSDPAALTPAHFLHTVPLDFLPAPDIDDSIPHLLTRYELLDKLVQSFWMRWRREYLHSLQARQKWNSPSFPVKEGTVVVVIQDNITPLHWPLGIITQTFKGKDDVIRVAMVRTKHGTYQRPVVKLCPLPTQ